MFTIQAFKSGFYGPHIVWVMLNWLVPVWLDRAEVLTPCTHDQLILILDQALFTGPTFANPERMKGVAGIDKEQFENGYLAHFNHTYPASRT